MWPSWKLDRIEAGTRRAASAHYFSRRSGEAVSRTHRYPEKSQAVSFNPVGQVVGQLTRVRKARDVVLTLVEEYLEAVERLTRLTEAANA